MKYISLENCLDRNLYLISSRNLSIGVFNAKTGGFLGLRFKFGDTFVFEEFHWDHGAPYGTVKPIEHLEELPSNIKNTVSLGTFCNKCQQSVVFLPETPESKPKWVHQNNETSTCTIGIPTSKGNKELHEWLELMEAKYHKKIQELD